MSFSQKASNEAIKFLPTDILKGISLCFSFLGIMIGFTFSSVAQVETLTKPLPKNLILVIGDGMGFEQVRAARMYQGQPLSFELFPYQGKVKTINVSGKITDSAAGATAMATGFKVSNGVVSRLLPGDGRELVTLAELYKSQRKSIGLLTNSFMTDATPAGFAAHQASRLERSEIANDYLTKMVPQILFGGGGQGMNISSALQRGYTVVKDRSQLLSLSGNESRVLGYFGEGLFPYQLDGLGDLPQLSEMTEVALSFLSQDPEGFFLLIENELIDESAHINDIDRNIFESIELSRAVNIVRQWASARSDTLILVTADHETGGLSVLEDKGVGKSPTVSWTRSGHSAADVPVYAWGYGGEQFEKTIDNTEIPGLVTSVADLYRNDLQTPCDFNGDDRSDFAVFRRGLQGITHSSLHVFYQSLGFSQSASIPYSNLDWVLSGDLDGDRLSDLVTTLTGANSFLFWLARQSSTLVVNILSWGVSGDRPLLADFDGDRIADSTVFRQNSGSWWSIRSAIGLMVLSWGLPGDLPVPADFDRDGIEDVAIWRPSLGYWAVLQSTRGSSPALKDIIWQQWGMSEDHPMPGDYNGDGKADLVVWRPSNGTWFICSSINKFNCSEGVAIQFGLPGDIPIHGDFDGDQIRDLAVWRPSNGIWYIRKSSNHSLFTVKWGVSNDAPVCSSVR